MALIHRVLGASLVLAFLVLAIGGLTLWVSRREEAPTLFWGLQHYTENLLIAQTVIGIVLLLLGRRVRGDDLIFLHYFYGSLFPLIAVVAGRIAALRRDRHEYVGLAWGAFFAFGLTTRALMTGCGDDIAALGRCLSGGA